MKLARPLPTWAPRILLGLVAATLLLVLTGLTLLLPYAPRLARAGAALPSAIHLVQQAPKTLEQVERIDGNVARVTPPVIAVAGEVGRVSPQLAELSIVAAQLHADVQRLQASVGPLGDSAQELIALGQRVGALQTGLQLLQAQLATMHRMKQHVANLDRKTGPTPP
jgi:type II secretory pathway component PulM